MKPLLSAAALLLGGLAGCGGGSSAPRVEEARPIGPHGGPTVELTDAARAEVVLEPAGRGGKSDDQQVVAYFYGPDMTTPLESVPAGVSVEVEFPGGRRESVPLEPEAGPRAKANRFASRPGPYAVEPLQGELNATVAGQAITKGFASAR